MLYNRAYMGLDSGSNALPDNTDVTTEDVTTSEVVTNTTEKERVFDPNEILKLNSLAEGVRGLAASLSNREKDGLSPLIEEKEIGAFYSIASGIEEITLSTAENTRAELEERLQRLLHILGQFGQVDQPRVFREDTDNLSRLSHKIRDFMDVCADLKSFQGSKENKDLEPTISLLNRITEKSDKIRIWLGKKRSLLEGRSRW